MSVLIRNCRLVTPRGPGPHRGKAMGDLLIMPSADVFVFSTTIAYIRPHDPAWTEPEADWQIQAEGRVLMPGFVDCHTHACFAGSRLDEWEMRLRGATYQDILAAGGGIHATVRAVRAASERELVDHLLQQLLLHARDGTTSIEVKSGYGLDTANELKLLRAISEVATMLPGPCVPTALLGHAIDPDQPDFVRKTIDETLLAVHADFPGIAVDVFVEKGAWSLEDARKLLTAAKSLGHPIRLHADQFTSMGGLDLAIELEAVSVDHLEASTPEGLARLAASNTIGVALPICGLHLDNRYANLRPLIDAGGAAAIATNFNPGSAPSLSMPLAGALAVRRCGLTSAEAITATTANAAAVLGLSDRGYIAPGAQADLILLKHEDERLLWHNLCDDPINSVYCGANFERMSGD